MANKEMATLDIGAILAKVPPMTSDTPQLVRGDRNKNPVNIKESERQRQQMDPWRGTAGYDDRHVIFAHPRYSYRALFRDHANKLQNDDVRTIRDIQRLWAPATDTLGSIEGQPQNNPEEAAETIASIMSEELGETVSADDPVDFINEQGQIVDKDKAIAYAKALTRQEGSTQDYTQAILEGLELYRQHFTKKD